MEKIFELHSCVESLSKEGEKFFQRNNNAAGTRARKKLQKCKKLAQEIRIMIQRKKQENVQRKSAAKASIAALTGGDSLIGEKFNPCENPPIVDLNFSFYQNRSLEIFPFPDFPQNSPQVSESQAYDSNLCFPINIDENQGFHPSFDD